MQKFTGKDLKVWLLVNDYTQVTLGAKLGLTDKTISNYCCGTPPKWLKLALMQLEFEQVDINKIKQQVDHFDAFDLLDFALSNAHLMQDKRVLSLMIERDHKLSSE